MSDDNKTTVRRLWEAVGAHDLDAWDELCAPTFVNHDPGLPVPDADLATIKQIVAGFYTAFPDFKTEVHDLLADGDRVAARWSVSGTHNGELAGNPPIPATGKTANVNAISLHRMEGGKIAEQWVHYDVMGMMQQLGVIPPPA